MILASALWTHTAALYIQLGANFVWDRAETDIFKVCNRRQIAYSRVVPLREIGLVRRWGAEIVKVFHVGNVGGSLLRENIRPLPWSRSWARRGGTTEESSQPV